MIRLARQRRVISTVTFAAGLATLPFCAALPGCTNGRPSAPSASTQASAPDLKDVTAAARIDWAHNPCRTGKKYLPETMGGGGGFVDLDADGWLDIVLINGQPLPGYYGPRPQHAIYHNNRDGTFTEVTRDWGLPAREYGMGLAVGDYNADGRPDIYVTGLGRDRLYRNTGQRLVEETDRAGVGDSRWSTGAAWIDYDLDGKLDLFVANYVEWSPKTDIACGSKEAPQYCPPYRYAGATSTLYRNKGNGTFEDVSARAGVRGHSGKTLAVSPCDVNADGWPDLHLANDTEPDVLLLNNGKGGFTNEAVTVGLAVGTDGRPTGSMGVDTATPFNDGRLAIAVGNFIGQGTSLFTASQPEGGARPLFDNQKREAALADPTQPMSTFGLIFSDVDLDGWTDLLLLNGHLDEVFASQNRSESYQQLPQLFLNERNGRFQQSASQNALATPVVGRGLAVGDYDNDGRQDFLAIENGGPARLWHNETKQTGNWLGVVLEGVRGPRDGTGATVTIRGPWGSQNRFATTSRSYLAANDPRVHFGLGAHSVDELSVRWPSGTVTRVQSPKPNQYIRVRETS